MKFTFNPNKTKTADSTPLQPSLKPETKPKPKNEQQHLADVYATFVKSFDANTNDNTTTNFVHGGSLDPNNNQQTPSKESKPKHYIPTSTLFKPPQTPTAAALLGSRKLTARDLARLKKEQQKSASRKKKRATQIHLLFEEMKARQQRDDMNIDGDNYDNNTGDKNDIDTDIQIQINNNAQKEINNNASTNLYVGNLPLNICETELIQIFGKYGIIGSVKIMWPRTEQEHARDRLCGFVSYIRRCDAEVALNELKDNHLFGERLRLGWGKPVVGSNKTETKPIIDNNSSDCDINIMEYQVPPTAIRYIIKLPPDIIIKRIIDQTAFYVASYGLQFENKIISREINLNKNMKFNFLISCSDNNKYYRWRVYSQSMGDSLYKWRTIPFQIIQNGPYWIPPKCNSKNKQNIENDIFFMKNNNNKNKNNKQKKRNKFNNNNYICSQRQQILIGKDRTRLTSRPLSDGDRIQFMTMLRALNCKRFKIKEAMIFCLDHSEFGKEVCEILSEALTLNETIFNKKLARLFLVSDVLCNCNTAKIKNASLYRSEFKNKHLMKIFKSLHYLLRNAAENKDKKLIKEKILKVLKVWDNNCVFPSFFTSQLKQIFIYGEITKKNIKNKVMAKLNNNKFKNNMNLDENEKRKIIIEKNKNLIYPPHSKLFIAKKTNNPNKAFTSYSFAKLNKEKNKINNSNLNINNINDDELLFHKKSNIFTKLIKNDKKSNDNNVNNNNNNNKNSNNMILDVNKIKQVTPGKYDGTPLSMDEYVDIDML